MLFRIATVLAVASSLAIACAPPNEPEGSASSAAEADQTSTCEASCSAFVACVTSGRGARDCAAETCQGGTPCETPEQVRARHARVAARRASKWVMSHRGTGELAHEVTLESYRATFELGADGHDIDVRASKDGVLVCFHDDMTDQQLDDAYGDPASLSYDELQRLAFADPGPYGRFARIPSTVEVLDLHRRFAGLLHLDVKRQGPDPDHPSKVEEGLAELLDVMEMWDHVVMTSSKFIEARPSFAPPRFSMTGFTDDTSPREAAEKVDRFSAFFVDDPRAVLLALDRPLGAVSNTPARREPVDPDPPPATSRDDALATLRDAADWDALATTPAGIARAADRIVARSRAADRLAAIGAGSPEVFAALEERVRRRTLHQDWLYMGLDGARALRALLHLHAPNAVAVARFVLERPEPDTDVAEAYASEFRQRSVLFPYLAALAGTPAAPDAAALCRTYLERAEPVRHAGFELAGRALLALAPDASTAASLLASRHPPVHRRAVLDLVRLVSAGNAPWARRALEKDAPWALAYVLP